MRTRWSAMLLLLMAVAAPAAQVDFFSPQGEVKGVRQVAVRFSDPMVAFGDPRLPEPFDVDCPAPGTGRWADQKNWVYDFAHDLPAGVHCAFRLKTDLVSLTGDKLAGDQAFQFSTGGPAVLEMLPFEGNNIDEEQVFLLGGCVVFHFFARIFCLCAQGNGAMTQIRALDVSGRVDFSELNSLLDDDVNRLVLDFFLPHVRGREQLAILGNQEGLEVFS